MDIQSQTSFFGAEDHCLRISINIKIIFVITTPNFRKKYKSQNQITEAKKVRLEFSIDNFPYIKMLVKTLCYRFVQSVLQLLEGRNCKPTASPVNYLASKSLSKTRKADYSSAPFILKMTDLTLYTTFSLH